MKKIKDNLFLMTAGFLSGICNGLFGAGGGIIAVEALKRKGLDQKRSQSTSISVILPLCILSSVLFLIKNEVSPTPLFFLIPSGLIGAYIGTVLMKKFSDKVIKNIFCVFILYAGIRMIFKG